MRPVAPCLILLLIPALSWAAADSYGDADHGSCVDAPRTATHSAAADVASAPTPAAHAQTAQPHPIPPQGGGNDSELVMPRMRMPRWHSFLPGMFR